MVAIAICLAATTMFFSCKKPVTDVTLSKAELTLLVGKTESLVATVQPDNADNKAVTWTSSNPAVASVLPSGLVTALSKGSTTIQVSTQDGNKTASCIVTVFAPHPAEPELISVEGGTFTMGCTDDKCEEDELPAHQVTVSSFKMAKFPVTQKQWFDLMGNNPSSVKGDNLPVDKVNWHETQEFIRRLNDSTGRTYRLPTEAEWEFAAHGGNKGKNNNYKYSGSNDINAVAIYRENSGMKLNLVGTKAANDLGLYDMSGNVWNWCSDWYDANYYSVSPQNNPTGPTTGTFRTSRGGSYGSNSEECKVINRNYSTPNDNGVSTGFRLVLQK